MAFKNSTGNTYSPCRSEGESKSYENLATAYPGAGATVPTPR
jgi:hypothetical protein